MPVRVCVCDTSECTAVGVRESKQTGQRHGKDIISERVHALCVTHEGHLLRFKTLQTEERRDRKALSGSVRSDRKLKKMCGESSVSRGFQLVTYT